MTKPYRETDNRDYQAQCEYLEARIEALQRKLAEHEVKVVSCGCCSNGCVWELYR